MPDFVFSNEDILGALESSPVAGGDTYNNDITEADADITVTVGAELVDAIEAGYDTIWCDADYLNLSNHEPEMRTNGQTIAGDRGINGSEGPILYTNDHGTDGAINVHANNCRITGVRIRGPEYDMYDDPRCPGFVPRPDPAYHSNRDPYYDHYNSWGLDIEDDNCEVDNCEIWGFGDFGIGVSQSTGSISGTHIHHNYLHDCWKDSMGYCIEVFNGARPLIEYNYLNAARRCIAGYGPASCSYVIKHNVFGPYHQNDPVDMHARSENTSGSNDYYSSNWSGNAGYNMEVSNNTFFVTYALDISNSEANSNAKDSYQSNWTLESRADGDFLNDIYLRGVPWPRSGNGFVGHKNELMHQGPQPTNANGWSLWQRMPSGIPSSHIRSDGFTQNIHYSDNRYEFHNKPYDAEYGAPINMEGAITAEFVVNAIEEGGTWENRAEDGIEGVEVTITRLEN